MGQQFLCDICEKVIHFPDERPVRLDGDCAEKGDSKWFVSVNIVRLCSNFRDDEPDLCAPCRNDLLADIFSIHQSWVADMRKKARPGYGYPVV